MLATAQSSAQSQFPNIPEQVASYSLISSDSCSNEFWCPDDDPYVSPQVAELSPSPGDGPPPDQLHQQQQQQQQLSSPPFDPSMIGIKQEQISESDDTAEDEPFQTNMFPGQPYADPSSSAVVFEEQLVMQPQDRSMQQQQQQQQIFPNPSQQAFFPRGNMSGGPQCAVFPSGLACGDGTNAAVLNGVVTDQNVGNLMVCENRNVKSEHAVTLQRVYKPVKLSEGVVGSFPFLQGIELPAILGGKLPPRPLKQKPKKRVYTERELRSRRKRGLPDDSDSESEERRQVRLPRRSLLTITTAQMSQVVSFMRSNLNLTPSQQDELSKQKRLVKNRESACRFRAKKVLSLIEYRDRVMELENDIACLRAENEKLRNALMEASGSTTLQQLDLKQ